MAKFRLVSAPRKANISRSMVREMMAILFDDHGRPTSTKRKSPTKKKIGKKLKKQNK